MAEYYTMTELIQASGISKSTLYRLREEGLPCVRVGAKTLYDIDEVMNFVNQRKDSEVIFEIGSIYTNDEICKGFKVGLMGGVRKSNSKRAIVVIASMHNEKFTHYDYWENDTLYFYGKGRSMHLKDQGMPAVYQSLANAKNIGYTIYLFEYIDRNEYLYRGIAEVSEVREEKVSTDENGYSSLFLFLLKLNGQQNFIAEEILEQEEKAAEADIKILPVEEVRKLAADDSKGYQRKVISTISRPSAVTKRYVLMRAQGRCELCGKPAPFEIDGEPYLQIDHIIPISKGGSNSIDNLAAVCPNCNCYKANKINPEMINTLQEAIKRDEATLQRILHKEE